jgi:hypothetical protein
MSKNKYSGRDFGKDGSEYPLEFDTKNKKVIATP